MNSVFKKALLATLICLALTNGSCAKSSCVFSNAFFTESRYKANKAISMYQWDNVTKELKAITTDGSLLSVKHWSCDHYGTHAVLILGPYPTTDLENLNQEFIKLARIVLVDNELKIVEKYIKDTLITLSTSSAVINIDSAEHAEFYLAYSIVNDVLVLEIKLYNS